MKSQGLFIYYGPSNFLFPCMELPSFPGCEGTNTWLTMVADQNCNSLLIPDKYIFAGELSDNLSVLCQQYQF